jgi:integrase
VFAEAQTSPETIAVYERDATKFVRQYSLEEKVDDCDMPYESRLGLAVAWFLSSHGRWSKSYIRRIAAALHQRVQTLVRMELINDNPDDPEKSLLRALKKSRPDPAKKTSKVGKKNKTTNKKKKKQRKKVRKSLKLTELRLLIEYFRLNADGFSLWIVGYLLIASRIGWRPGETVRLRREGNFLRAKAEKHGNGRGLTDTCEVDISAYPDWLIAKLDQWIAGIGKWEERYEGLWNLRTVMNGRLATACRALGIPRVSTYTLRHFAVACMKRSGFSQSEIAVLVNHASNRTATEKYGKGRGGIKRAKKMLRFQAWRLNLVRDRARQFGKHLEGPAAQQGARP